MSLGFTIQRARNVVFIPRLRAHVVLTIDSDLGLQFVLVGTLQLSRVLLFSRGVQMKVQLVYDGGKIQTHRARKSF